MPEERSRSIYDTEKNPQNRDSRSPKFDIGDVVELKNGTVLLVVRADRLRNEYEGMQVEQNNGQWSLAPGNKTQIFAEEDVSATHSRNIGLRNKIDKIPKDKTTVEKEAAKKEEQEAIRAETVSEKQLKEPEKDEKDKNRKQSYAVSFSVISRGDIDGFVKDGNSYETIITGETTNGVTYRAHISGGPVSRSSIEAIANAMVKSQDRTNENADERHAYSSVQDIVNNSPDIETVSISGGPIINRDELGIEESVPVGMEFSADADRASAGASPSDPNLSLDEILNQTGGIPESSPLYSSYEQEEELDAEDFEIGNEPWNEF